MVRNTLIGLIVGTSLSLSGLFINSASAQQQNGSDNTGGNLSDNTGGNLSDNTGGNLSDNTGGNISDNTGGNSSNINTNSEVFGPNSELTFQILDQANQLAESIENNFNRSGTQSEIRLRLNNRAQANTGNRICQLRAFVLDKPESNSNCNRADNSDSVELNTLLKKADEFLVNIDRQVERANSQIAKNRLW
ncbi:MAG: hypothetical protein VKN72_18240 [Nostocales cyanobacterium 94392]|nr:hypothetical protein [Nostocales cyanobacterium 94392]